MKACLLLSLFAIMPAYQAHAQQDLTGNNVVEYDFADFSAAGFSPNPTTGQLDSDEWVATRVLGLDLNFGETSANQDFANGPSMGGESAGGVWAFAPVPAQCGSANQTMLGVQPSNMTFSPGSFRLQIQNNTGADLTEIQLQYAFAWFNDSGRSMIHSLRVQQLNSTGIETGSITIPALTVETPVAADQTPAWSGQCQSAVADLSSIPIANGDNFAIVFDVDDGSGSGTRDEVAIGEVRVATMAFADAGPMLLVDASVPDGGSNGSLDAGMTLDASGTTGAGDAGAGPDGSSSGCGCASGGRSSHAPFGLLLFALLFVRLRRGGVATKSRWRVKAH